MKVFLDDTRTPPAGWTLVRWPEEAIRLLETGEVTEMSLDHDLGDLDPAREGYAVLSWIEEAVATRGFVPPLLSVHSSNGPAGDRMRAAIASIERYAARNAAAGNTQI